MGAFSAIFSMTSSGETMDGTQKSLRPKMMARTTAITMQNIVEIARERMKCDVFITGRICRRQLCRYCFYSRADLGFFAPQGKIWHGGADRPLLHANFILIGRGVGVYGPQN